MNTNHNFKDITTTAEVIEDPSVEQDLPRLWQHFEYNIRGEKKLTFDTENLHPKEFREVFNKEKFSYYKNQLAVIPEKIKRHMPIAKFETIRNFILSKIRNEI